MTTMLETPSRIWRRIEEIEARDMPSLPSLPGFENSIEDADSSSDAPMTRQDNRRVAGFDEEDSDLDLSKTSVPLHSTPTVSLQLSTLRGHSSTSSTQRFANSIARSSLAARSTTRSSVGQQSLSRATSAPKNNHSYSDSFDVSAIPSLPDVHPSSLQDPQLRSDEEEDQVNGELGKDSLSDALESVSRTGSPYQPEPPQQYPKTPDNFGYSFYDYQAQLKMSSARPSPVDKYKNIVMKRPLSRTRTPSLTHTNTTSLSSSANSTPRSGRSLKSTPADESVEEPSLPAAFIPLPLSNAGSPAVPQQTENHDASLSGPEIDSSSMDITEAHISPVKQPETDEDEHSGEDDAQGVVSHSTSSEREPTFTDSSSGNHSSRRMDFPGKSPDGPASVTSSPAQSMAMTPTPAYPRPRARFSLAQDVIPQTPRKDEEGPVTPHTRRKSFLLSVINSTTRPRMKMPTPFIPRNRVLSDTPSPETEDTTATESSPAGSGLGNLQTAFVGVTPRPRFMRTAGRLSHPLIQTYTAGASDSESQLSPHEGASFVSTASSHDLTTNPRANTSFDPAMGFAGGAGANRFNAAKLNNYLHGLNRRLQEENEVLVEKLRLYEEQGVQDEGQLSVIASTASQRWSGGGRRISGRISAGSNNLGNVKEDVGAEGWVEEKEEFETLVGSLKEQLEDSTQAREAAEKALDVEQIERARDKERWKERMAEVEQGVSKIVEDLEHRLRTAQEKATASQRDAQDLERQLADAKAEKAHAVERASAAEEALENGQELGGELKAANERISSLMTDLRSAKSQVDQLENECLRSDEKIDELDKQVKDGKTVTKNLESRLRSLTEDLDVHSHRVRELEQEAHEAHDELEATKAYVSELEESAGGAVERIETLENDLAEAQQQIGELQVSEEDARDKAESLEEEMQRSSELARQMEEALEAAEAKMRCDEETVAELRGKVASLEKELARAKDQVNRSRQSLQMPMSPQREADVDALEEELDEANKEIARLRATIAQSPARKAMEKAKDTKIEILEKENEDLQERIKALRTGINDNSTPNRLMNASGISPIHRQVLSMAMRTPKTPGGPLRDMSWLNNTTHDPSTTPLLAEIARLQMQLDHANESIDDKLDQLQDSGLGVVGLTRKLQDARDKIAALEDEIAKLTRKDERRQRRLARARCQKCLTKFNIHNLDGDESSYFDATSNLPPEPPTPATRTSNELRAELTNVNSHLLTLKQKWEDEKRKLLGEKHVLQETTNRLNMQIRGVNEENAKASNMQKSGQKQQADVQAELDKAKRTISELEQDLKTERSRLRGMATEQSRVQREKEDVLHQMQRAESDMEDVRLQLQKFKQDNRELESELRGNTNAQQRARLLEAKVSENLETINQLREERTLLVKDHKELQKQFTKISEHADLLREEYASSHTSHENRRHQLDLHLTEIDELRRALTEQADELHNAEAERKKLAAERSDIGRTIAALEADLKRVRKDAEAFGRDLKLLRAEKENMEAKQKDEMAKMQRAKKQAQTQIRVLTEQLEGQKAKTQRARDELAGHVCTADDHQIAALKLQHSKECKGLIVQIKYLKAKFTRESSMRFALIYQKDYLLVLLMQLQKTERTIFAAIARIGFPVRLPAEKQGKRLKSVAMGIIFVARMRKASQWWREQCASKPAIQAALQEVRRKRQLSS